MWHQNWTPSCCEYNLYVCLQLFVLTALVCKRAEGWVGFGFRVKGCCSTRSCCCWFMFMVSFDLFWVPAAVWKLQRIACVSFENIYIHNIFFVAVICIECAHIWVIHYVCKCEYKYLYIYKCVCVCGFVYIVGLHKWCLWSVCWMTPPSVTDSSS